MTTEFTPAEEIVEKEVKKDSSTPRLEEFNPTKIPFQHRSLWDIKREYDYKTGTKVVLFSGAVGSAKSVQAAHLIWLHALENPGAYIGIGRKDLKRLKSTLLKTILAHAPKAWKAGIHFKYNKSEHKIVLPNKTVIQCFSWADGDYDRFRSEEFTMFCIEEASENDKEVYDAVLQRIGRLTHVKEKIFLLCTNPDEPEHWINREIIMKAGYVDGKKVIGDKDVIDDNIHVYYSLTKDNPFLDPAYLTGLLKKYNQKQIQRFLEGKWISYGGEGVYFAYRDDEHFIKNDYVVDENHPIYICFDFNVAKGKPMSLCFMQYINDVFHFFDECVVEGSNTSKILDEVHARNQLKYNTKYIIAGDAAGWSRGTNTGFCDYDVILKFFANYTKKLNYDIRVPLQNPGIKDRHNMVNSYLKNGLNEIRLYVYKRCKVLNEGLKLTKLKDGAKFQEEDGINSPYQHISTACGYGLNAAINLKSTSKVINR